MILLDANLLLYAYNTSSADHDSRAFALPLSRAEAVLAVSEWLDQPQTVVLGAGENHWTILQRVLSQGKASGPLVSDAHLAALAVEHGATLYSTDRDFARFPNLKFENPLGS